MPGPHSRDNEHAQRSMLTCLNKGDIDGAHSWVSLMSDNAVRVWLDHYVVAARFLTQEARRRETMRVRRAQD